LIELDFFKIFIQFIVEKWDLVFLSYFVVVWYLLYKKAVKNEMNVLVSLYSQFKPPYEWQKLLGERWIPLLSVGLTLAFIGLAFFIDNLNIFILIMLILNILDIRGNNLIRQNLSNHFRDKKYEPDDTDLHKVFIIIRRLIAEKYWIIRPQIERITYMIISTICVFVFYNSNIVFAISFDMETTRAVSVVLLCAVILSNEIVMGLWRVSRDQEIEAVDVDQGESDRRRVETAG